MKQYFKYLLIIFITIFSFYYANLILKLTKNNNTILVSIEEYASKNDYKCIEGSINENGIILGMSGLIVNKNKSYSNMKGIGFKSELIEYDKDNCILNKENNMDKYIISGNKVNNNISIVIDVETKKYYEQMIKVFSNNNANYNLLINVDADITDNNLLLKFKNEKEIKEYQKINKNYYCVEYYENNIIEKCLKNKHNTIRMKNYINKNMYSYIKKNLDKGEIFFIKENEFNLNELLITINYIKSRGYSIISINELFN